MCLVLYISSVINQKHLINQKHKHVLGPSKLEVSLEFIGPRFNQINSFSVLLTLILFAYLVS